MRIQVLNNLASKIIAGKERFEREKKANQFVQKYTGRSAALTVCNKQKQVKDTFAKMFIEVTSSICLCYLVEINELCIDNICSILYQISFILILISLILFWQEVQQLVRCMAFRSAEEGAAER